MPTLLERPARAVTDLDQAAALPRLDRPMAQALAALCSRRQPLRFELRGQPQQLRFTMPGAAPLVFECIRFRFGAQAGLLGVDLPAAAQLMGERRIELLPPELRCVLWADALQALSDAVEQATRLRLDWMPQSGTEGPAAPDAHRALHFVVEPAPGAGDTALRACGFLQFDDESAWPALAALLPAAAGTAAASPAEAAALDRLRLPLSFQLGTTALRIEALRAVEPGDIVGIEDWHSAGRALRVTAQVGGPRGVLLPALAEGQRITVEPSTSTSKDLAMNRDMPPAELPGEGDAAQMPLDRLDALEVVLRFEVGELAVSLGELRGIRAGHVFELPQALNRSVVRIVAHGNLLGRGTLVAVGDRLGVRVTEFAPGEL